MYRLLILLCFIQAPSGLPKNMDYHKVNWSEYLEVPPNDSIYSAMTGYDWNMRVETRNDGRIFASVKCSFLPYFSYTRTNDSETLFHERLHLALAEIYARQLDKALKAISGCKSCEETVNSMYQSAWTKMIEEQDLYDSESGHSTNADGQSKWSKKISNQLKQVK